jgi:hypothetical protein
MRNASAIAFCLLLTGAEAQATGEASQPAPSPPYYAVPGPDLAQIDALESTGHHKKRVGAILLGFGGALALAGTGLMIAGAWHEGYACGPYHDHHYRFDGAHTCGSESLVIAGGVASLFAIGAIIPGASIYASGGHDVADARDLRRRYWGSVSLSPAISHAGAGIELALRR